MHALSLGTLVNGICANARIVSQNTSLLSFIREEEHTWSPLSSAEGYKQGSLASLLQWRVILPWLELYKEGTAGFSVSLDKRELLNGSHYVHQVRTNELYLLQIIINSIDVFCTYIKRLSVYLTILTHQCLSSWLYNEPRALTGVYYMWRSICQESYCSLPRNLSKRGVVSNNID